MAGRDKNQMAAVTLAAPGADLLGLVMQVYERGQIVEALRRAETHAPLRAWRGSQACVIAARIAANAGAPRLATRLSVRARCEVPGGLHAIVQYGYEVFSRRGALALWDLLGSWDSASVEAPAEDRAELLALKARALADLRDFARAESLLRAAEAADPDRPWVLLQRAHVLERQDRIEEALDAARLACSRHPHPFYRPGTQEQAHLLQLLDRDDESIALLQAADAVLQSSPVAAQLYALLSENGRWKEAAAALGRFVALAPLLEPAGRQWADSQRARMAYRLGQRVEAARLAAQIDDDFHRRFSRELAAPHQEDAERAQLDVSFVRQHFKTCAPATLAAIARYWRLPADHVALAEAMCYDGTPAWQQREWAEGHGWCVREFRVTLDSAVALIGRGVPFALCTTGATSAHMMCVAGHDRIRGTLLLRDPGQPYIVEVPAAEFFERHRAFGPRGTVFLPEAERARLDGLELPELALYDRYHRLCLALSKHDRPTAATELAELEQGDREAAVTWEARLFLAAYDANVSEQGCCLDRLLELFPHDPARQLYRLNCLGDAGRDERLQYIEHACARRGADPALYVALARTLQGDARRARDARWWLRRAMRQRPMDSATIHAMAGLLWDDGQAETATDYYYFAAGLEGFRESMYASWFIACRRTRRADVALEHLRDRYARFGSRSSQPALTLAWALREMEQPGRAREVLTEAVRLRPDDGPLLLRFASFLASVGEPAEADRFLADAAGKVRQSDWLCTASEISELRLDMAGALRLARDRLQLEPLALDTHARVARLLARLEGDAAALEHLRTSSAAFPCHCGLQRMVVEWSRPAGSEAVAEAAQALLRLEPADAWAQRELALACIRTGRHEEALRAAEESAVIEPGNTFSLSVLGHVHRELSHVDEARALYRRSIVLSVDNGDAIYTLLQLAPVDAERRAELDFIRKELVRQVVAGDGLLAYLETARPILEPEALLAVLREAHLERPDLWHAWSALASQLGHLGRFDEALAVAQEASRRFPHIPRIQLDLSAVHRWRNEPDAEIAAAEQAFEANPAWDRAVLTLAGILERRGRLEDARRVYERALSHAPHEAQYHACLAHVLWRLEMTGEAFASIEHAIKMAPANERAWELLSTWSVNAGEPKRPAGVVRSLAKERPGDMRVWLIVARLLDEPADREERLAAVDRALALAPRSTEAWDMKAELLALAERFDAAIQTCADGAAACSGDAHILRGRRAWIEARRRHLTEAVALMRGVLAENACYVWGWQQLAIWLIEQDLTAEAAVALEQLQRLRPHDAWVSRQLGVLRLKQNDKAGARKAFTDALASAPTDVSAAHNLFDLQLEASDIEGAAATVRTMQTHQPGASTLAANVTLLLRRREPAAALKVFETLCAGADPDPWPVNAAAGAFRRSPESRGAALRALKRAIRSGAANPQAGTAAIEWLVSQQSFADAARLFRRLKPGEEQRRAAAPLIKGLGDNNSRRVFRRVLRRHREVLFADDAAWGQVGFALSNFKQSKQVVRWMSDWRERANIAPWMLFNLCLALRQLGRCDEATNVARHVVQNWGHRPQADDMQLFIAVEDALGGRVAEAADRLRRVVIRKDNDYDRQMLAMTRALVDLQQVAPADRRQKARSLRLGLAPQIRLGLGPFGMRDVRRTFGRVGRAFRREGAGTGTSLWFAWRLYWPWLVLPFIPLALIVALQQPAALAVAAFIAMRSIRGHRRA